MHPKCTYGRGSAPNPARGAYSAPQTSSCIWGADSRHEEKGEERGEDGREGKAGVGKGRKGSLHSEKNKILYKLLG